MDDSAWQHVLAAQEAQSDITRALGRRFGDDAEDYVAEALLRVCTASTRDDAHAKRLTATTATGLAIDASRHRGVVRKNAPRLADPTTSESPEDAYIDTELRRRVAHAVAELPPLQRDVMLRYADGRPAKDIAEQVGRSTYSVKHVIARTLHQLREQLRDAELAILAWRLRRRRRALDIAASPALAVSMPAFAVVVTLSLPLAGRVPALLLRALNRPTIAAGRTTSDGDLRDTTPSGLLHVRTAHRSAPTPRRANTVDDAVARTFAQVPRKAEVRTQDDGGPGVFAKKTDGQQPVVQREPDYDDPIGDAVYCVENVEISPTYVGCRPRP